MTKPRKCPGLTAPARDGYPAANEDSGLRMEDRMVRFRVVRAVRSITHTSIQTHVSFEVQLADNSVGPRGNLRRASLIRAKNRGRQVVKKIHLGVASSG